MTVADFLAQVSAAEDCAEGWGLEMMGVVLHRVSADVIIFVAATTVVTSFVVAVTSSTDGAIAVVGVEMSLAVFVTSSSDYWTAVVVDVVTSFDAVITAAVVVVVTEIINIINTYHFSRRFFKDILL